MCSRKSRDEKALGQSGGAELLCWTKKDVGTNTAKYWRHCPSPANIGRVAARPSRGSRAVINATELLGQILQSGISNSARTRLDHARVPDGPGEPLGGLAEAAEEFIGADRPATGGNPRAVGGSAALAGAVPGRGRGAMGALGSGALAVLSGLALSALGMPQSAAARPGQVAGPGRRPPQDPAETEQLEQSAILILAAMINAAKADGQVDQEELQRILGKLREVGADAEALDFVLAELRKPMDLEGLIRRAPSEELAVQMYAASLLAIEVDTEAERQYLRRLAHGLGLEASVVRHVHQCFGVGHA
jgi:uncharacterized membrane protein YebE (DUF533 family)